MNIIKIGSVKTFIIYLIYIYIFNKNFALVLIALFYLDFA